MQCTAKGGALCQQSTKKQVCILLDLQADQWHTSLTTQVVSLTAVVYSLSFLVTHKIAALLQNSSKDF